MWLQISQKVLRPHYVELQFIFKSNVGSIWFFQLARSYQDRDSYFERRVQQVPIEPRSIKTSAAIETSWGTHDNAWALQMMEQKRRLHLPRREIVGVIEDINSGFLLPSEMSSEVQYMSNVAHHVSYELF